MYPSFSRTAVDPNYVYAATVRRWHYWMIINSEGICIEHGPSRYVEPVVVLYKNKRDLTRYIRRRNETDLPIRPPKKRRLKPGETAVVGWRVTVEHMDDVVRL